MLSYLFRQFFKSVGIFFRTIRAYFTRAGQRFVANVRRATNLSRYASKVAVGSVQGAATALKKPTKREDYIETKRMFISKSFLLALAIGVVVFALLFYFLIWPFLLSHFFVAHFYQEDKTLETWSGRVVIYYDQEKTMPLFKGKLEDGVRQGKGSEYDRGGLMTFEGHYVDGVYSGKGVSYQDGCVLYEGDFANGLYEGKGSLYYNGEKVRYTGDFVAGLYEGSGTSFYPDGTKQYVGDFSQGEHDGQGTSYWENGEIEYSGGFSAGLYEGEGSYYLSEDSVIDATFTGGVTDGEIQWRQDGSLWYSGGADNLTPHGFGTVYGGNGKIAYAGQMDHGTIDGLWLLGLSADEVREAFGEAKVTETDRSGGFLIENETFGLSVLCSYQSEEAEASAYQVFFHPEKKDLALLPWEKSLALTSWAENGREEAPKVTGYYGKADGPKGPLAGEWNQTICSYSDYICTMLWANEHGTPVQLSWVRQSAGAGSGDAAGTAAAASAAQAAVEDAQERLDGIMDALDQVAADSGKGGASSPEGKNSQKVVSGLLASADSAEEATTLMNALTDCYTYSGMVTAMEGNRELLNQQLSDATQAVQRGTGSQKEVDSLQSQLDQLGRTLAQYQTGMKQAKMTAKYYCGNEPDTSQLQRAVLTFDPVKVNAADLCKAAVDYAGKVAADRYEVDSSGIQLKVKSSLLDLNMAYEGVTAARQAVDRTAADVETRQAEFSKGTATRSALLSAQMEQNTAVANLCEAMGTFTHRANELNTLTGGWVAQNQKWMPDAFANVFQGEIDRGQQEAAELALAQEAALVAEQQAALEAEQRAEQQAQWEASLMGGESSGGTGEASVTTEPPGVSGSAAP